jgi:hypothetical protein
MSENQQDSPLQWMRDLLGSWLNKDEIFVPQLLNWLQGYDLPPIGHHEEPYLWLLRALPTGSKRPEAERSLAQVAQAILQLDPDVNPQGNRPEQLTYNLLMLSAGLSCPDELAEPLFNIFVREKLSGTWMGIELRSALRVALTENQIDNRLKPVWEQMVSSQKNLFLLGNDYDGFEGILLMPLSQEQRGEPDIEAIGKALKMLASAMEEEEDRGQDFRFLINRVFEAYPGRPSLQEALVYQADKNNWPYWAVEALPTLCFHAETQLPNAETIFYLWRPLIDVFEGEYRFTEAQTLCDDQVVIVSLPQETVDFVEQIGPIFDWNRYHNPYMTVRSSIAVMADTMAELEIHWKHDQRAANAFRNAREKTLQNRGIGFARGVCH